MTKENLVRFGVAMETSLVAEEDGALKTAVMCKMSMARVPWRRTSVRCALPFIAFAAAALSCAPAQAPVASSSHAVPLPAAPSPANAEDAELDRVAAIHGAPGPWAVAGYRMGRHALGKLGLLSGSFDLEVIHHTPHQVMYSCMADGAAAATGASLGKLNLSIAESSAEGVETTYRKKSTGQTIALRPTAKFRARFADVPRDQARELGRAVLRLADGDIFEEATGAFRESP